VAARLSSFSSAAVESRALHHAIHGEKGSFTNATLAANLESALTEAVRAKTSALNTPKHANLKPLFERTSSPAELETIDLEQGRRALAALRSPAAAAKSTARVT
jgi:hypothetical protein